MNRREQLEQIKRLKEALAEFRRAQAELERSIAEQPPGEAGRARFEAALTAAVEAGNKMQVVRRLH